METSRSYLLSVGGQQHGAQAHLLFLKTDTPGSGSGQLPLQLFHVPAQGLDGLHKRLVCHSLAPPST